MPICLCLYLPCSFFFYQLVVQYFLCNISFGSEMDFSLCSVLNFTALSNSVELADYWDDLWVALSVKKIFYVKAPLLNAIFHSLYQSQTQWMHLKHYISLMFAVLWTLHLFLLSLVLLSYPKVCHSLLHYISYLLRTMLQTVSEQCCR